MSTDKKLHKNESIKTESNFLRGNLEAEIDDPLTGGISDDSIQLIKFHGSYLQDDRDVRSERRKKKLEKAFSFMLRLRIPGGKVTAKQWLDLDKIADTYANGTLRITTRQTFQFHGIIKSVMKPTMQAINETLLDTIAACGDVNRNVMCYANPHASEVHAEVEKLAKDISEHLLPKTGAWHEIWLEDELVADSKQEEEPIYGKTYLPRKFKTVIAVPPSNDVDIFAHDLGFIAIVDEKTEKITGYNVTVGGGMGMTHGREDTYPRTADILGFCKPNQAVEVAEKVVLVQKEFGNRSDRAQARLKYTIEHNGGIEWFRSEVQKLLKFKLGEEKPYEFTTMGDEYGWVKGTDGKHHLTLYIQSGRVKDTGKYKLKTALQEIAKIHDGTFIMTANQNLIIAEISDENKPAIEKLVNEYQLFKSLHHTGLRLNSISCVALPTCGLALAESERYLPDLITELEEVMKANSLRDDAITIRMTGCPNGCGRPYLGEIGFVGKGPNSYNVYLGAAFNGTRLNKLYRESVPGDNIVPLLKPIITDYANNRLKGEHFGDFTIRAGYVNAADQGPGFHEDIKYKSYLN